jgi:hypothetical protein
MSQVNFFMTEGDEDTFFDFLFSRKDTHILSGRFFDSRHPLLLFSKELVGKSRELTLVNKEIMPQPEASNRGRGDLAGKYLFGLFHDPTIELLRSRSLNMRLLNGRIYAKIGWLKPKEANAVYRSWYGSIERWLKKHYKRVEKAWWFGPGAWDWSMAGGVCCFGHELALAASLRMLPATKPPEP